MSFSSKKLALIGKRQYLIKGKQKSIYISKATLWHQLEILPLSIPNLGVISQWIVVSLSWSFHRRVQTFMLPRQMYNFLILLLSVYVSLKRLCRVKEMRKILITESYRGKWHLLIFIKCHHVICKAVALQVCGSLSWGKKLPAGMSVTSHFWARRQNFTC